MFPIRDDAPRSTTPYINYTLVFFNVAVFLFEWSLPSRDLDTFLNQFGLVPARVDGFFHGGAGVGVLAALLPFVTTMFLHANWLHLGGNMMALWIFGDNIEDRLGHFRDLIFYFVSGLAAGGLQVALNQGSTIPTVGASGAIAGVMGAFFLLFPTARVLTILPFGIFFVWLPAWVVLGYWFVAQFLSGAATSLHHSQDVGGVAFWAHVGGFMAGATMIKLLPARAPRYSFIDHEP